MKTKTEANSPFTEVARDVGGSVANGDANGLPEATTAKNGTLNAADLLHGGPQAGKSGGSANGASGERIDAVRELLFGDQVNELQETMRRLESQLLTHMTEHEEQLRSAAEEESRRARSEFDRLGQEVKREAEKREAFAAESGKRMETQASDLGDRMLKLGEQLQQSTAEIRKELKSTTTKLADETREAHRLFKAEVEAQLGTIRSQFTRRDDLGLMLAELGKRLQAPVDQR